MKDYPEIGTLTGVYLEDSFVIEIAEESDTVKFKVDAVLAKNHPMYREPKHGEQYCYADGWLVFAGASRIDWVRRCEQRFTDAAGDEDLGNIDYLKLEQDHWLVGGDWGEVRIFGDVVPELVFASDAS